MSMLPNSLKQTYLYSRLATHAEYIAIVESIRNLAESMGRQIERLIPDYTDHSVRHMDALWSVADAILTTPEINQFTPEELLLLCCAFYVHDLGMAAACTNDGVEQLRLSSEYKSAVIHGLTNKAVTRASVESMALRTAARILHAEAANSIATEVIPGLDRYLIENSEIRNKWAKLIGEISASHHWSLQQVENRLGRRNSVPTADGGTADLAFVACVLRIADYAHINRDRAFELDRRLRSDLSVGSSLHWDAQANITGPNRDSSQIVYGCTAPVTSIEAWWLFYDMAAGLDTEIRLVRDYLEGRRVSANRFSLQGVRGAESPESFAAFVLLESEIAPIDIRVQPHSMERVIDLLGGPALYRGDPLAPLRELIQNCRDAIALKNALETSEKQDLTTGKIKITLDLTSPEPVLSVSDNGIGMTRSVVKNHLISVASDFWASVDYARDFSRASEAGFQPIGRFGIGFLSVFMLGNYIEVETERSGSPRVLLRLRGIGRRGELVERMPTGRTGTVVRITLTNEAAKNMQALDEIARARAPMLPFRIVTEVVRTDGTTSSVIEPRWWNNLPNKELHRFLADWNHFAKLGRIPEKGEAYTRRYISYAALERQLRGEVTEGGQWPGAKPEFADETGRLIASGTGILLCSHGIAIEVGPSEGVFGIVEVGEIEVSPDRSLFGDDKGPIANRIEQLTQGLVPRIREAIDNLESFGSIPARHPLLRELGRRYGADLLANSTLRWIPTLEQPGNLIHKSRTELLRQVEFEDSIVVCSGIRPRQAYELAARRLESSELKRGLAVLFSENEFKIDYNVERRLEVEEGSTRLRDSLDQVIQKAKCHKEQFLLLGIVLDLIAEAWCVERTTLDQQLWEMEADSSKASLWVNLKRPPARR